jgi:O-antigen/teichoic acid export membrane protein
LETALGTKGPAAREGAPDPLGSMRSVGRGTAILVLGTLLLFLFGFLSRVLIARTFSRDEWGAFSLGLALAGLLSIVSLLGLDQALARALAFERSPSLRQAIIRHGLAVATLAALGSSAAVYVASGWLAQLFHMGTMAWVLQLFGISVGPAVLCLVLAAVFQGFEDAVPNALFNQIINPGLFVAAVLLALLLGWGFSSVALGYLAAQFLTLGLLIAYAARRLRRLRLEGPRAPAPVRALWRLSASLWGVGTLAYVTAFVDTLVLGIFRSVADVGTYAAMMTLGRILLVSNGTLTYIYLPVASRLARDNDYSTIRSTYLAGTRWVLLLVTPGCLLLLLQPQLALQLVFGPGFSSGTLALQILVVPAFLAVLVGPSNACLAGVGRFRALLGTTIVAAAANVALSFGLIPVYGIVGAALAWGIARALYPALGWLVLYRLYRINPFASPMVKPLVFSLAFLSALYLGVGLLQPPVWTVVPLYAVGVLVALAGLLLTKSVIPGDVAVAQIAERAVGRPLPWLRRLLLRALPRTDAPASAGAEG